MTDPDDKTNDDEQTAPPPPGSHPLGPGDEPLSFPRSFTAGQVANASEVNANFDAGEAWANGTLADDKFAESQRA